jgi:hypothetical protein
MQMKTLKWLTIFSIAMGYMESAVVIYLRKIYYPQGFQFPLVPLEGNILLVEIFREAATIIMLLGIGILSGKTASLKFAYFIFCFAIWDIFYYIFLWLFIGWPESLFTWDILFLIPFPWVGPVITPCIVSLTMLLLALSIIRFQHSGIDTRLKVKEWILFSAGSFVIVLSFVWDFLSHVNEMKSSQITASLTGEQNMLSEISNYVPEEFNWPVFLIGEAIILYGIIKFILRIRK